jgi:hypothetical protein
MKSSNKTDLTKLSHLIRAGAIVHSVDGGIYRCTSKLASGGAVLYRLADLQGKPIQTPADFHPISPALARFAAWARYVVAFNQDFDLYVKEYIRAAGLPVDETINWSKWFAKNIGSKLMSRDPEVQDEAIHHIIILVLAEYRVLDSSNPSGFSKAIKKFPERIQKLPLARQVTVFLFQTFLWRVGKANEYIKRVIFQDNTSSMWQEEGGDNNQTTDTSEVNLLDTEDQASTGAYDIVESDVDISRFREGFSKWLYKKCKPEVADEYLILFDLIYEEIKASEGIPKPGDVFFEWYREIWLREGNRGEIGKEKSVFKMRFSNLSKLIAAYIDKYMGKDYDVPSFLQIMQRVGQRKLEPAMAASKIADSGFYGLNVAQPEAPHTIDLCRDATAYGEGCPIDGCRCSCHKVEDGESKSAAQWEVPTCKSCGSTKDARECPACKDHFCGDCLINHHANNPSHG